MKPKIYNNLKEYKDEMCQEAFENGTKRAITECLIELEKFFTFEGNCKTANNEKCMLITEDEFLKLKESIFAIIGT